MRTQCEIISFGLIGDAIRSSLYHFYIYRSSENCDRIMEFIKMTFCAVLMVHCIVGTEYVFEATVGSQRPSQVILVSDSAMPLSWSDPESVTRWQNQWGTKKITEWDRSLRNTRYLNARNHANAQATDMHVSESVYMYIFVTVYSGSLAFCLASRHMPMPAR